jgi:membrane protease subunit HflC
MANIQDQVKSTATAFGIEVIDVRIGRTELPDEISANVYQRMRSEREREANLLRAEGDEIKQRITADADRQRVVILAEAQKQAQIAIGQGEAERNRITAEAYGRDPQFFAFVRSMAAYRQALASSGTTLVLPPDSDFFRFFNSPSGIDKPQE